MKCSGSVVAAALALLAAPPFFSTRAVSDTLLDVSPSVRSWGLGIAGVADDCDPANAFFNPAVIASQSGVFATGGYGKLLTFVTDDTYTYNMGAGIGLQGGPPGGARLRFGAAVRYSVLHWEEYEARDENNNYLGVFRPVEQSLSMTAGLGAKFGDNLQGSLGLSIKPWWYDDDHWKTDDVSSDLGALLKYDFEIGAGMRLSWSIGWSYLNMGGGDRFFENMRYGMGSHLEGGRSKLLKERLGVDAPSFTITALVDGVVNRLDRDNYYVPENAHSFGAEVGVAQTIFVRIGNYAADARRGEDVNNTTYGFGAGLPHTGRAGSDSTTRAVSRALRTSAPTNSVCRAVSRFNAKQRFVWEEKA